MTEQKIEQVKEKLEEYAEDRLRKAVRNYVEVNPAFEWMRTWVYSVDGDVYDVEIKINKRTNVREADKEWKAEHEAKRKAYHKKRNEWAAFQDYVSSSYSKMHSRGSARWQQKKDKGIRRVKDD